MSQMEYNKGKLIPSEHTFETLAEELGCSKGDSWQGYRDAEEYCRDNCWDKNYQILKDKIYKVVFEVDAGELDQLCNVQKLPDGSVMFETYHYNGGAHWTELVEKKL